MNDQNAANIEYQLRQITAALNQIAQVLKQIAAKPATR